MKSGVSILGIFVADTAYMAHRMPKIGETIAGSGCSVGPGGKGSNQAVAAARAGGDVNFISKLGNDTFGAMALETYEKSGVTPHIVQMDNMPTGAAFIYVNDSNGDNAIIVYPGAAGTIGIDDVEAARGAIENSAIFVTQLEQPVEAALHALQIAKAAGVTTLFNPAPAEPFPEAFYELCDYIAPNETEAAALVGFPVNDVSSAQKAAKALMEKGVGAALITLGAQGVLYCNAEHCIHIPAISHGEVIDTSGAGDAFVGGFSAAFSRGKSPEEATRFGCATAGIAVTRRGTAPAMPDLSEIEAVLNATRP